MSVTPEQSIVAAELGGVLRDTIPTAPATGQPAATEVAPTAAAAPDPQVAADAPTEGTSAPSGGADPKNADAAPAARKERSRGGMAQSGAPIGSDVAPAPTDASLRWPDALSEDEHYVPYEFDASDLSEVNRQINAARARLFRTSQVLKRVQRTFTEASLQYDREMRRQLVTITGGTAQTRQAMAELNCEVYEDRVVIGKQIVEEWKKKCTDARDDLKAVENIAHNARAQIDVR